MKGYLGIFILLCFNVTPSVAISYLVSLKPSETLESFFKYDLTYPVAQQVKSLVGNSFSIGNFTGFTGNFPKSVVERLKRCPMVGEMTPDIEIKAFDVEVQENCPRHLARLSQEDGLGDELDYAYDSLAIGSDVNAYVLDSGVEIDHPEFEGRAHRGRDFTTEGPGDLNGHGTHVAGIVGSRTYGVAKNVDIIEIKALDKHGAGSLSTIIAGLEFAVNHRKSSGKPGVANLSLGAAKNSVLNRAVQAAVDTGLVVVVAAGNSNINACSSSPASAPSAITVGAIDDATDSIASFSNWGPCVDIMASGSYVSSLNAKNYNKPQVLSGTSMSSPVVSGLIASLLSAGVSPFDVRERVIELSAKDKISRTSLILRRKTPNRIAYNGIEYNPEYSDSDSDSDE
ncbi:Piso0_005256 [Millerozyma farinosa CBS 7064]|uniref:Piso0_005256 protein n=1 Tax=Pichia sorbitophila (strain ATCC MYA-4447 / BCRC 22081 / CBS 7064 / NBRC 10061 / NRRL Y-12695) TaxID=559304 RepID=G8Y4M0_PICSO|nr:Piso0_005256 [Millerozyma farinosa CBS 7064]